MMCYDILHLCSVPVWGYFISVLCRPKEFPQSLSNGLFENRAPIIPMDYTLAIWGVYLILVRGGLKIWNPLPRFRTSLPAAGKASIVVESLIEKKSSPCWPYNSSDSHKSHKVTIYR